MMGHRSPRFHRPAHDAPPPGAMVEAAALEMRRARERQLRPTSRALPPHRPTEADWADLYDAGLRVEQRAAAHGLSVADMQRVDQTYLAVRQRRGRVAGA